MSCILVLLGVYMGKTQKTVVMLAMATVVAAPSASARNDEYRQWLQQTQTSYQEYRDKRDREFTDFLQKQWKEMEVLHGIVRDKTPKPARMPVARIKPLPRVVPADKPIPVIKPLPALRPAPTTRPDADVRPVQPDSVIKPLADEPAEKPLVRVRPAPETTPAPAPAKPEPPVVSAPAPSVQPVPPAVQPLPAVRKAPAATPAPEPAPATSPASRKPLPNGQAIDVSFYGRKLRMSYDPAFRKRLPRTMDEQAVSQFWSLLSRARYEDIVSQLNDQRDPLGLNDWGYALLVDHLARGMYPGQANEQRLFTWFIMTKAGYMARIGYNAERLFLLLPSQQPIYAAPYLTFEGTRYYALRFDGGAERLGRVYTYDGHYPGASRKLDMRLARALNTGRQEGRKNVSFNYGGHRHTLNLAYDRSAVAFLNTYPQLDIDLYFASDVSPATANPLVSALKPLVKGRSEREAVNLILRFVQTSFQYKTDAGQFGTENYLFLEETLHYPYSDCEDRSVLFAWLVRKLLGLEVVGLSYPGHIAAAVRFRENVAGDAVQFGGKRYVVTDPTYINANAGMTMPNLKRYRPKVISITG